MSFEEPVLDRRRALALLAGVSFPAATALSATSVWAQGFPGKPITIMVATGAGSSSDVIVRLISDEMAQQLGQPIIVEPRPGVGGNVASIALKRAAPDGYTLLINGSASVVNPSLYPNAGYDPTVDHVAVAMGPSTPNIITVHPSVAANTMEELLAQAKREPLNYTSSGIGTTPHLTMERLKREAGADIRHIPNTPAGAATYAVAGHVQIAATSLPVAVPFVRDGRLKAIAVTTAVRSPALPEAPTLAETGFPAIDDNTFFGFFAAAGTPPGVVATLNGAINTALTSARAAPRFKDLGFDIVTMSAPDFSAFVSREVGKWRNVIQTANIRLDG